MAAAFFSGGIRPHPLGLRPRPQPSSEMEEPGQPSEPRDGVRGRASARRPHQPCHRTPGHVKGAFGVASEGASAPLDPAGEPGGQPHGRPTRRCPIPSGRS